MEEEEDVEAGAAGPATRARLNVDIMKVDSEVHLRGDLTATLSLSCSRCLESFTRDVTIPLELEYRPLRELEGEETYELRADELDTGFYEDDELDLGEISREQVLLNLPMKPLCTETCKGICPKCGANLNEAACGCDLRRVDERLQGLDKFLKRGKE
ncbi:MAG: DUF177 domain-containing protein [Thermodesulfovibrionales bacterium]